MSLMTTEGPFGGSLSLTQGSAAILGELQQGKLALTRPFGWAVGDFFIGGR